MHLEVLMILLVFCSGSQEASMDKDHDRIIHGKPLSNKVIFLLIM